MGKGAGPNRPGATSGCARRWALAGLIGLAIAWDAGLFAAVGARLRGARTVAGPARGSGEERGLASGARAAARDAATALRGPVPGPEPPRGRPLDSPAPRPPRVEVPPPAVPSPDAPPRVAGAAEPRPGASMLQEGRPGPALPAAGAADPPAGDARSLGQELFARTWRPDDPRCHGGDGLGPVYNAASCLDCHSLGGPGGAGPVTGTSSSPPASAIPSRLPVRWLSWTDCLGRSQGSIWWPLIPTPPTW